MDKICRHCGKSISGSFYHEVIDGVGVHHCADCHSFLYPIKEFWEDLSTDFDKRDNPIVSKKFYYHE